MDWFGRGQTLAEAIALVELGKHRGLNCPCCGQYCRSYTRKITYGQCWCLIKLSALQIDLPVGDRWVHVERELKSNTMAADFSKLRFWDLVISKSTLKEGGGSGGFWQLTPLAWEFIFNLVRIPKKIHLYDNKLIGKSKETINIQEALESGKFNYNELMADVL